MRQRVALAVLALLLPATAAAQLQPGGYLKWDQCAGAAGTVNRDFACDSNDGVENLVVSFVPAFPLPQLVGIEVRLDYVHSDFIGIVDPFGQPPPEYPPLQPWWQFQTGGCRAGFLQSSGDFGLEPYQSTTVCSSPWSPNVAGGIAGVQYPYQQTGRARVIAVAAVPPGDEASVVPGQEYYGLRFLVRRVRTTGAGMCDGCCTKTVIALASVRLYQPAGVGDQFLMPEGFDAVTSWQFTNAACEVVPARTRTWGQIKGLFR